jgi:hypothetical protein
LAYRETILSLLLAFRLRPRAALGLSYHLRWLVDALTTPSTKRERFNAYDYLSGEFTDDFLHAHADIGDQLLEEEGFQYRSAQYEMKKLALEGTSLLLIDCLKGK